ncbi:hypothetical protein ISF_05958 [Cordyceps fumosorosea ARSEF 2679]|uniref:Ubiquinol-cytochrome-c reductase cytochrome c1 n=1 Tax=Cordyceps fumosorosea (strain ARSEF 2679) TaxID=1081104 RepID=A0A167SUX0_CORFA|nr:hypothetical protein ISF_05958 [Cordyceps fumosorosea ARSEF 2679]OAA59947.1 hypothetical protein ISF_05958 [Cordyceps fumosorosea ARSEF 2679]
MSRTDAGSTGEASELRLIVSNALRDLNYFTQFGHEKLSNTRLRKRLDLLWQSNQHIESVRELTWSVHQMFTINNEALNQIKNYQRRSAAVASGPTPTSSTASPERSDDLPASPEGGIIEELLLDDVETHPDIRLLILVPFIVQHHLCLAVQSAMEAVCFAYAQKHLPNLLHERQWDCPEAASLPSWIALLNRCPDDLRLPPGLVADHARTRSCLTLYEAALARARLPYESLRCGVRDALATVQALGGLDALPAARAYVQNLCGVARKLREQMRELEAVAGDHRERLREALENIAERRAALDKEDAMARQSARDAMAEYEAKWDAEYKAAFAAQDTFCSS